jgi:hypothetical protein
MCSNFTKFLYSGMGEKQEKGCYYKEHWLTADPPPCSNSRRAKTQERESKTKSSRTTDAILPGMRGYGGALEAHGLDLYRFISWYGTIVQISHDTHHPCTLAIDVDRADCFAWAVTRAVMAAILKTTLWAHTTEYTHWIRPGMHTWSNFERHLQEAYEMNT